MLFELRLSQGKMKNRFAAFLFCGILSCACGGTQLLGILVEEVPLYLFVQMFARR